MHGDPAGTPTGTNAGRGFTIGAFVCAAVALILVPLVGVAGVALGVVGYRKGDPLGKVAAIVAGACAVAGFIIGAVLLSNARNN